MRLLILKLGFIPLLFLGITGLKAQNTLYVKAQDGTQTSYPLNEIRKLTFPLRNISVTNTDGTTEVVPFMDIHYVNFTQWKTGNENLTSQGNDRLVLFPNPVNDQLTVMTQSILSESISIQIIDMQGKIVYREAGRTVIGPNHFYLKLSHLPGGLYVCSLNNGQRITTGRFLKN